MPAARPAGWRGAGRGRRAGQGGAASTPSTSRALHGGAPDRSRRRPVGGPWPAGDGSRDRTSRCPRADSRAGHTAGTAAGQPLAPPCAGSPDTGWQSAPAPDARSLCRRVSRSRTGRCPAGPAGCRSLDTSPWRPARSAGASSGSSAAGLDSRPARHSRRSPAAACPPATRARWGITAAASTGRAPRPPLAGRAPPWVVRRAVGWGWCRPRTGR